MHREGIKVPGRDLLCTLCGTICDEHSLVSCHSELCLTTESVGMVCRHVASAQGTVEVASLVCRHVEGQPLLRVQQADEAADVGGVVRREEAGTAALQGRPQVRAGPPRERFPRLQYRLRPLHHLCSKRLR